MKNVEIAEGGIGRRLNGTRSIITDEPNTSLMDFWVDADDRKTKTLYITQNGSYNAEDDGVYAYSSITVSVRGGSSGSNSDGGGGGGGGGVVPTFPTFPEYTDEDGNPLDPTLFPEIPLIDIEDIETPALIPTIEDENGNDTPIDQLFPEILEDPLADVGEVKMPDTVGEEGSAITGIDPEDGYTYKADVDENGNLEVEKVPTGIQVIEPPDKTEYGFDEDIDTSGMKVALVDKDGNIVKTKEYPDGIIPNEELTDGSGEGNPPKTSDRDHIKGTWTFKTGLDLDGYSPQMIGQYSYTNRLGDWVEKVEIIFSASLATDYCTGPYRGIYASSGGSVVTATQHVTGKNTRTGQSSESEMVLGTYSTGAKVTIDGRSAYYTVVEIGSGGVSREDLNPVIEQDPRFSKYEMNIAWLLVYGGRTATEDVPVKWNSPYSGVTYEDGTTVTASDPFDVLPEEEGSNGESAD